MPLLLDISRHLLCARMGKPTGIDRVEMAYARYVQAQGGRFAARSPWGWYALLPDTLISALIDNSAAAWEEKTRGGPTASRARAAAKAIERRLLMGQGIGALHRWVRQQARAGDPALLVNVSHRWLDKPAAIARLKHAGARFAPMLQDLIPISHPEYTGGRQTERHELRLETIAQLADVLIYTSDETRVRYEGWSKAKGRAVPRAFIAPLGITVPPREAAKAAAAAAEAARGPAAPYFVILSTIEGRKNHLLLLNIWRDLCEKLGDAAPELYVIGRRGWENQTVLAMLDRCTAIKGKVKEMSGLEDAEVWRLLAGARALLFPTFVEGFGLPLAEALALGTPALAADIPPLREVGGAVPEYLDPLDGLGWRAAILDYAQPDSAARAAQLKRLESWRPPNWPDHFAIIDQQLNVSASTAARTTTLPPVAPEAAPHRSMPVASAGGRMS